jgi:hypothetical protein
MNEVLALYKRASLRFQKFSVVESIHRAAFDDPSIEVDLTRPDLALRFAAFSADCDSFSSAWFSSDFPRLSHFLPILSRQADLMANEGFREWCESSELPIFLIEIVDVHDSENLPLRDFEEADQGIVALAFDLFTALVSHSDSFSAETLVRMAETAVRVFPDLSPDSKFAAAKCLSQIFSELPSSALILKSAPNAIELCRSEVAAESDPGIIESLVLAVAMIARRSDFLTEDENRQLFDIVSIVWSKRLGNCLLSAIAAFFHVLHNNWNLIEIAPIEEIVIEMLNVVDSPEVLFYVFELLQLSFLWMDLPRLMEFHSRLDYSVMCGCLDLDWRVQLVIAKVVGVAIERSPAFLREIIGVGMFDKFLGLMEDALFELKQFLIGVIARGFCRADEESLRWMIERQYYLVFGDGITTGEAKILRWIIRALIVMARVGQLADLDLVGELREVDVKDDKKTAILIGELWRMLETESGGAA